MGRRRTVQREVSTLVGVRLNPRLHQILKDLDPMWGDDVAQKLENIARDWIHDNIFDDDR